MRLSRYEQEVIINFNAEDDETSLYTANPVWIRKMDKLLEQNPEQFRLGKIEHVKGEIVSKEYFFPKQLITIRSGSKKRTLSDDQKLELAERLKHNRRINSTL